MMHGKTIWKFGIHEIVKASRDIALNPTRGEAGLQHPIWTPSCKGQRADTCWVVAYGHKTQSFMKNGGQQKCLVKALRLNCFVGQKLRSINNSLNQYFNSSHPITYIGYISNFI